MPQWVFMGKSKIIFCEENTGIVTIVTDNCDSFQQTHTRPACLWRQPVIPTYLVIKLTVFVHSFHSYNIGLQFRGHSYEPVEGLCNLNPNIEDGYLNLVSVVVIRISAIHLNIWNLGLFSKYILNWNVVFLLFCFVLLLLFFYFSLNHQVCSSFETTFRKKCKKVLKYTIIALWGRSFLEISVYMI